jgi:hypothetical protein
VASASEKVQVVYLIGSAASSSVKIGRSDDVARRLAEIQRMSPVKLEVLWQVHAGGDLETALHRRFKAYRMHGEWFDFGEENPVALVGQAAAEETERLKEVAQSRARWDPWERTEVFLMNGVAMVMPPRSEGGWQCVAWDEQHGRRCRGKMSACGPGFNVEWVVPGLGSLSGNSLDGGHLAPGDEIVIARGIRRALKQVCDRHEDSEESKRASVAWRRLDLRRDRWLIRPFTPGSGEFNLLPGLEEMDARVRAFAESLIPKTRKREKRA